jgi:hypothetical protein
VSALRTIRVGLLLLLGSTAGLGLAAESPSVGKNTAQPPKWTSVTYDGRGLLDPQKLFTAADRERAVAFFGTTTNPLDSIILPLAEGLLTRVHEPPVYTPRTNAARQEYRLVYLPNQKAPTILHCESRRTQTTLRVYRWRREECAFLSEAPVTTTVRLPPSAWQRIAGDLASSRFWEKPNSAEWWSVKDGSLLILEVIDRGRYHLVCRAAGEDEEFEKLCQALLESAPELSSQ